MSNKERLNITPRKFLVIKPSSLGDIIHSLPFLYAIRKRFPTARIHWVVAREFHGILEGNPMLDKLHIIDKSGWKRLSKAMSTVSEFRKLSRQLKSESFDIAIDLQGLLRSGLIAMASGAKIRLGLKGFKEAREGSWLFHTHKVDVGSSKHAVDRYMRVASFLGCDASEIKFPLPEIPLLNSELTNMRYAVLVPGARWDTKRWPPERFGALSDMIYRKLGVKSVVVGTKEDTELAEDIISHSKGSAISLAGKTSLKELMSVIKSARFLVTTDSGPMHIASALGVPVFALFGPTSAERTGPYGGKSVIIKSDEYCSPCLKRTCKDIKCMNAITAQEVFEIIQKTHEEWI